MVIADLHIGIEYELSLNGVNIPSQTDILLQKCKELGKEKEITKFILLGDVKHIIFRKKAKEYHMALKRERRDVHYFLSNLAGEFDVWVIKGNHDGGLKIEKENISIYSSKGTSIGKIGFVHGHAWPSREVMEKETIIMAHTHPVIRLKNYFGHPVTKPCWLRGWLREEIYDKYKIKREKRRVVVIPAFNPLCGGIAVNKEGVLGPLGKFIDVEHAHVHLLNGTYLGYVKNIRGRNE